MVDLGTMLAAADHVLEIAVSQQPKLKLCFLYEEAEPINWIPVCKFFLKSGAPPKKAGSGCLPPLSSSLFGKGGATWF